MPLGEKTDVWGIGNVIWKLIVHSTDGLGPMREDLEPGLEINEGEIKNQNESGQQGGNREQQEIKSEAPNQERPLCRHCIAKLKRQARNARNGIDERVPLTALSFNGCLLNFQLNLADAVLNGSWYPASHRYSEELKELIRQCLSFNIENRPTLRNILDRAEAALQMNPYQGEDLRLDVPEEFGFESESVRSSATLKRRRLVDHDGSALARRRMM